MIKQCGYCLCVYGNDGEYHDIGLTELMVGVCVTSLKKKGLPVSHGICAECFDVMMSSAQTGSENSNGDYGNHRTESEAFPVDPALTNLDLYRKAS